MDATVLIEDDHSPFRAIAREVLEAEGYTVVGEAADGRSAITAARTLRPELVLLDVQLPDADGRDLVSGFGMHGWCWSAAVNAPRSAGGCSTAERSGSWPRTSSLDPRSGR